MPDSVRFPTAIGECSISWNDHGLTGVALPDFPCFTAAPSSAQHCAASSSCPSAIAVIVARVQRHLAGDLQDFADLAYDWSRVTEFQSRVLRAVLAIAPGRTATYGDLARALGAKPGAARAIGGAVGANPWPLLVPCHRILGAGGRLTGYSAPGGTKTKAALLALEKVGLAI